MPCATAIRAEPSSSGHAMDKHIEASFKEFATIKFICSHLATSETQEALDLASDLDTAEAWPSDSELLLVPLLR